MIFEADEIITQLETPMCCTG